jgi:hypothetical protein
MSNENNNVQANSTNELAVRREKLKALVDAGKNPFEITKYDVDTTSREIKADFENFEDKSKLFILQVSVMTLAFLSNCLSAEPETVHILIECLCKILIPLF